MVKENIKLILTNIFNQLQSWLSASIVILLGFSNFVIDIDNLPIGFEANKAEFYWLISLILLPFFLYSLWINKIFSISNKKIIIIILCFSLIIFYFISNFNSGLLDIFLFGLPWRQFGIITILSLVVIGWFISSSRKRSELFFQSIVASQVITGIFAVILSLSNSVFNDFSLGSTEFLNIYGQSNFLSTNLTIAQVIILYSIFKNYKKGININFIFKILILIFLTIIINFSGARYIWFIQLTIFISLFIYLLFRNYKYYISGIFILLQLGLIIFIYYFDESRLLKFQTTWQLITQNVWSFLFGYGSLDMLFDTKNNLGLLPEVSYDRSHNIYLDIWFSYGLVGIFLFSWFIIREIISSKRFYIFILLLIIFTLGNVYTFSNFSYLVIMMLIVSDLYYQI